MKLMDDGENQAVRSFLMLYKLNGVTVACMQDHMISCGFPHWPEWADTPEYQGHLTKGGAQDWLRHLFGLETKDKGCRNGIPEN